MIPIPMLITIPTLDSNLCFPNGLFYVTPFSMLLTSFMLTVRYSVIPLTFLFPRIYVPQVFFFLVFHYFQSHDIMLRRVAQGFIEVLWQ
jgi:hypothetical protein